MARAPLLLSFLAVTTAAALVSTPVIGAPARAAKTAPPADTTPPVIVHTPPASCPLDAPCVITATITDDSGVFDPTLLYKAAGATAFERLPMTARPDEPGVYTAAVPAAVLSAGDVAYFVEAFDIQGNGPARAGDETAPLLLKKPATTTTTTPPPPPPPPPEPRGEDNTGLVVGAVVGGVVVAVIAGAGIAWAAYALRPPAPDVVTVTVEGPRPFTTLTGAP